MAFAYQNCAISVVFWGMTYQNLGILVIYTLLTTEPKFVLSAHTGVANVHLFASEQPTSKKGRVFVEKPMAEGGLKKHS